MCDPASIVMISASLAKGYADKQQGNYAKGAADYNARVTENQATATRNKGVESENVHRQKVAQLQSQQRAQLGASGVELDMGSAADIQQDTWIMGEADALRIRGNFLEEAKAMDSQATFIRSDGLAKQRAGNASFNMSLLTSAGVGGMAAAKWYNSSSAASAGGIK